MGAERGVRNYYGDRGEGVSGGDGDGEEWSGSRHILRVE